MDMAELCANDIDNDDDDGDGEVALFLQKKKTQSMKLFCLFSHFFPFKFSFGRPCRDDFILHTSDLKQKKYQFHGISFRIFSVQVLQRLEAEQLR